MSKRPMNYTNRDFETIKSSLVNYARRYYANTYQDFNEASFGALMVDLVSYLGDQLSFYTDYQANESFLDTAIEAANVDRIAKQMGFKRPGATQAVGICDFFVIVPASANSAGPDSRYFPILKQNTLVTSDSGAVYTLTKDVDFTLANNEVTVARVDADTGVPTFFAIKASGPIVSGRLYEETIEVGDFQRFLRLRMSANLVSEIISVVDSQGKEYFQVDYLTQDVVVSRQANRGSNRDLVPFIMKTKPCPRRFVVEHDSVGDTHLQFGYGSEENLTEDLIADPADVVLDMNARNYVSDTTFDPSNLIKTDKFGVVPENTTLTIVYRGNASTTVNTAASTIDNISDLRLSFEDRSALDDSVVNDIITTIEVTNPEPVLGDTSALTVQEVKTRAYASFATQNRAVTRQDYISLAYRMPSDFGKLKRVGIEQDPRSSRRNLNMYVLAEDLNGGLTTAPTTLKNNLKTWINRYKMINDSVDILDGKVINFGIEFEVIGEVGKNKFTVLRNCISRLQRKYLNVKLEMGEPIYISDIFKVLNRVEGVVDTTMVKLVNITGGSYSSYRYEIEKNMSNDGRFLIVPTDAVAEMLFPNDDITGVVK